VVVDQQCRALVTQAGAGAAGHADQAVLADTAGRYAQAAAQVCHQRLAAEHAVGDVVAEQDSVLTHRLGVEETVEAGHALHMGQAQAQPGRDVGQRLARQPTVHCLQLAQDLHQRMWVAPMTPQQRPGAWRGPAKNARRLRHGSPLAESRTRRTSCPAPASDR
jgi:hypothetical protein